MPIIEEIQVMSVKGKEGRTFGGRLLLTDGKVLELLDIHPDPDRARQFLEQLLGEEAEEKQLWYYLEDFLAR